MNVLILGKTNEENYLSGIITYAEPDDTLYTLEFNFNEILDSVAEKLQMKLFLIDFFDSKPKIEKTIYFTDFLNVTEMVAIEESVKQKKPIIFLPL